MALDFDGATQGIIIPQAGNFPFYKNNTTYSICGWVKAPAQNGKLVWAEGESSSTDALVYLGTSATSPYNKLRLFIRTSAPSILLNIDSTTTFFDDTWHHFCWVDNNGTVVLYIDGTADATNFNYARSGNFNTLYTSIMVNARGSGWGGYVDGIIYDIRCYNRCLTTNEVVEIYHKRGADRVLQGLVGQWRLDDLPSGIPAPLLLDSMDSVTGWTVSASDSITLNETTYKEGNKAINFIKATTARTYSFAYKTISSTNVTGQVIKLWIYIKDQTTLNKINYISPRLYSTYDTDAKYKIILNANLTVGWNLFSMHINDFTDLGTPIITAITAIRVQVGTNNNSDTISEGDVVFDFYRAGDYPFQAPDLSGNGNHGVPYNSPVYRDSPHRLRRGVLIA